MTRIPTPTIQPIHFTSQSTQWRSFHEALGLTHAQSHDEFLEVLSANSGQLLLAGVEEGSYFDGVRLVELVVPDLNADAASLQFHGVHYEKVILPHREAIAVGLPHGRVHVCQQISTAGSAPVTAQTNTRAALVYGAAVAEGAQ